MPVDMKGYKVVYGSHAYKCLMVETIWDHGYQSVEEGVIERPWKLRVSIIDHDGYFGVIENYANQFAFLKEAPNV